MLYILNFGYESSYMVVVSQQTDHLATFAQFLQESLEFKDSLVWRKHF